MLYYHLYYTVNHYDTMILVLINRILLTDTNLIFSLSLYIYTYIYRYKSSCRVVVIEQQTLNIEHI